MSRYQNPQPGCASFRYSDKVLAERWVPTLAAGAYTAAERSPAVLLVPIFAAAALWIALHHAINNRKRSRLAIVAIAPVV